MAKATRTAAPAWGWRLFARTMSVGLHVALILATGDAVRAAVSQQAALGRALDAPVKNFILDRKPVIEGLFDLAYEYRLPLGIEYIDADLLRRPFKVELGNVSVRVAIESLVKHLPEYRVSFSDGLVDLYSPRARRNRSNILNMTMAHFQVSRVDALEASHRLWGEVFVRLHPGQGFAGHVPYGALAPSDPRVTLNLENRKVYEILNAIVAADGEAMWLVQHPPRGLSYFEGNLWYVYNLNPAGKDFIIAPLRELFPGHL
jgi:hypothetical protein